MFKTDGGAQPPPVPPCPTQDQIKAIVDAEVNKQLHHVPTTGELWNGFVSQVSEGAVLGGLGAGIPSEGALAVPGALVGGAVGGIKWFIDQTQK